MLDLSKSATPEGESLARRLTQAVKSAGGASHISRVSGVPLRTLNNYLGNEASPPALALKRLADACGVGVDWLLGGSVAASGIASVPDHAESADVIRIPLVDAVAGAGHGLYGGDAREVGEFPMAREAFLLAAAKLPLRTTFVARQVGA